MILSKFKQQVAKGELSVNFKKPQSSNGKLSISVIRSEDCGKRLMISTGIVDYVGITSEVFVALNPVERTVMIFNQKISGFESIGRGGKVSGKSHKIFYNAGIVEAIVDTFKLDYSTCTSKSFDNVELLTEEEIKFAVVHIPDADTVSTGSITEEIEEEIEEIKEDDSAFDSLAGRA